MLLLVLTLVRHSHTIPQGGAGSSPLVICAPHPTLAPTASYCGTVADGTACDADTTAKLHATLKTHKVVRLQRSNCPNFPRKCLGAMMATPRRSMMCALLEFAKVARSLQAFVIPAAGTLGPANALPLLPGPLLMEQRVMREALSRTVLVIWACA